MLNNFQKAALIPCFIPIVMVLLKIFNCLGITLTLIYATVCILILWLWAMFLIDMWRDDN